MPNNPENQPSDTTDERQSQLATVLIGILIIVAGFLIYTVFSNQRNLETTQDVDLTAEGTPTDESTTDNQPTTEPTQGTALGGSTYVVKAGDTLWSISEDAYNDGYKWREIAEANNISLNDTGLEIGDELTIPALGGPEDVTTTPEPTQEATEVTPTPTPDPEEQIDEGTVTTVQTYTVQRGDTLWAIAEKFYGDGNKWMEIFEAEGNDIATYTAVSTGQTYPLIHAGNILVIPSSSTI